MRLSSMSPAQKFKKSFIDNYLMRNDQLSDNFSANTINNEDFE
jgi:hypothetical protein